MMGWINALRPTTSMMAGILSIIGFSVTAWHPNAWLIAIFVTIGTCATMVHNDWRDRYHDIKKNKDFALNAGAWFLFYDIMLWAVAIGMIPVLGRNEPVFIAIALTIVVAGLLYSETRLIPILPQLIVAITSATPVLFGVLNAPCQRGWSLFWATTLLIYASEILMDINDCGHDRGYKWTLPLAIGHRRSKFIAGVCTLFVPFVAYAATPTTLIGAPMLIWAGLELLKDADHTRPQSVSWYATMIVLAAILLAGP